MLAKRIIPCLDVRAGKVTKGIQFLDNVDVGDPAAMARYYYEQGADEIVFYDITASNERRGIMIDVVRAVARDIFIPFSVGGGLRTLEDMRAVLLAGRREGLDRFGRGAQSTNHRRGCARIWQPMYRALDAGEARRSRATDFPRAARSSSTADALPPDATRWRGRARESISAPANCASTRSIATAPRPATISKSRG